MAHDQSTSNFLVDTNVISEWVKPRPNQGVVQWLSEIDEDRVFLSVVSLAEFRHGIERMSVSRRRDLLAAWLQDDLPMRFEGRVLDIDRQTADICGLIV